ncbi:MAG: cytoplasmic [Planctomycetota bacterium]|nr:MAG: cytoplasmic [Planctomycetota bacterium]
MKRAILLLSVLVAVPLAARFALGEDPPAKPKARFAILYTPGEKWVKGKSIYEQPVMEHGKYMGKLLEDGKLIFGGPFKDSSGGEAIVEVTDAKEAQAIVDADPAVKDKVMNATVHEWHVVFDRYAK